MKNIVKLLLVAVCIISCSIQSKQETPKKVYETTWMELTKTDSGYVVYNYPDLEDDNFKTPQKIVLKGDSIIWITYSEMPIIDTCNSVQELADEEYFFPVGNHYKFEWSDKEKHIAKWTIYYGDERILSNRLYIDSVYNTYQVIDDKWFDDKVNNN